MIHLLIWLLRDLRVDPEKLLGFVATAAFWLLDATITLLVVGLLIVAVDLTLKRCWK